jgi:hypothetical protein
MQAYLRTMKRDTSLHNKLEYRRIVLEQDEVAENAGRKFEASQSKELQGTTHPEENVEKRGELNVQHEDEEEVENSTGIGIEKERDGSSQEIKQMNTQQESEEQHPMHERQYPSRDA